jgi:phage-related protein
LIDRQKLDKYPSSGIINGKEKARGGREAPVLDGIFEDDLLAFPGPVRDGIGLALSVAQFGGKHPSAKPWKGEGPGVMEIVEDHGDAYRAVYTVRFARAIYVLHAFQKKSTHGIATSQRDKDLITRRLRAAQYEYEVRYGKSF